MTVDESLWRQGLSAANQLSAAVKDEVQRKGVFETEPDYGFVLVMFWRIARLFDGVVVLVKAELPEESALLGRSMFVESLFLAELAEGGQRQRDLIAGWLQDSITNAKGLVHEARKSGLETATDETTDLLKPWEEQLESYKARHRITRVAKRLSVYAAAKKFGRLEDYWMYEWAHEAVHGSDIASFSYRRLDAKRRLGVFAKTNDPSTLLSAVGFAAESFVHAARATFEIVGWRFPDAADEAWKEIEVAARARGTTERRDGSA